MDTCEEMLQGLSYALYLDLSSLAPTVLNIVPGVFLSLNKGMLNTLKKLFSVVTNSALSHI